MENKIFFKEVKTINAEYNNKWKKTDKRRKIVRVEFSNGLVWYPKNLEIDLIKNVMVETFKYNIQFPNIDVENA